MSARHHEIGRMSKECYVILDVLDDVDRYDRVGDALNMHVLDVRVDGLHSRVAVESLGENGKDISRGLDDNEAFDTINRQQIIGKCSDASANFHHVTPQVRRESADNPVVVVSTLGNCFELGTRVLEIRHERLTGHVYRV